MNRRVDRPTIMDKGWMGSRLESPSCEWLPTTYPHPHTHLNRVQVCVALFILFLLSNKHACMCKCSRWLAFINRSNLTLKKERVPFRQKGDTPQCRVGTHKVKRGYPLELPIVIWHWQRISLHPIVNARCSGWDASPQKHRLLTRRSSPCSGPVLCAIISVFWIFGY